MYVSSGGIYDRVGRPAMAAVSMSALAAMLLGCDALDRLLDVTVPSQVEAESLDDPRNAPLLLLGMIADFECALGHYIIGAGLVSDEFADAQSAGAYWDYDRRTMTGSGPHGTSNCDSGWAGIYVPLSVARFQADDLFDRLSSWTTEEVAGREGMMALASAFSGYAHVLMGEAMCSAAFDGGPELLPDEIHARGEERFTRAIELASSTDQADVLNLAHVGRARARVNRGNWSGAEEDARRVEHGFVYHATYSASSLRRNNAVFVRTWEIRSGTVGVPFRSLTVQGVPDPRVDVFDSGMTGNDQLTPLWLARKYPNVSAPIPIARWEEAQLIIAEAVGGQEAVDILNRLRDRHDLPHFESTDPQEIVDEVVLERSRELFLEGHRLGDMNRLQIPLEPPPGTPYPPKAGGTYGDQTCFPLPDSERFNNPNIP